MCPQTRSILVSQLGCFRAPNFTGCANRGAHATRIRGRTPARTNLSVPCRHWRAHPRAFGFPERPLTDASALPPEKENRRRRAGEDSTTHPVVSAVPLSSKPPHRLNPTPSLLMRIPTSTTSCSLWVSATAATAAPGWEPIPTPVTNRPEGIASASACATPPRSAARSPRRSRSASLGNSRDLTQRAPRRARRLPPQRPPRTNRAPTSSNCPRAPASRWTISSSIAPRTCVAS